MAEAPMKRGTDSLHSGGVPKKAKLLLDLSDADSSSPTPSHTSPSPTALPWEKSDGEYLSPFEVFQRVLYLQELQLYLISKGCSDEVVDRIKKRTPENAFAPDEDVEKALDGFHQKGWCLHIYTPGFHSTPGVGEALAQKRHFTGQDLYPRLQFRDYPLPFLTTYQSDLECLSFLQEFEQHVKHWISKQEPSCLEELWSDEGLDIATDLAEKKYPLVGLDQLLRAVDDVGDVFLWDHIAHEMDGILLNMWIMVVEDGDDSLGAFLRSESIRAKKSKYCLQRVFNNPSISALLRETFDDVYNANTSCSEEEIMPLFQEAVRKGRDKLPSYYPRNIQRKIDIAKEIRII